MSDEQRSEEEIAEMIVDFEKEMGKSGNKTGEKIAHLAGELHPDALLIVPLYRSAVVVLPKNEEEQERGSMSLVLYHDPRWMGADDITTENLPRFKNNLKIWGQRSGPDLTLDGETMLPGDFWETLGMAFPEEEEGEEEDEAKTEKDSR